MTPVQYLSNNFYQMIRILPFWKGNKTSYNSLSHDQNPFRLRLGGTSIAIPGQKAARKYVILDLKNEFLYHYSNKRLGAGQGTL